MTIANPRRRLPPRRADGTFRPTKRRKATRRRKATKRRR